LWTSKAISPLALRAEVEAAVDVREQFWVAHDAAGARVGWLWLNYPLEEQPPSAAFLYQILVKPEVRRQSYAAVIAHYCYSKQH
jgi:hypothetical protein